MGKQNGKTPPYGVIIMVLMVFFYLGLISMAAGFFNVILNIDKNIEKYVNCYVETQTRDKETLKKNKR
jgi:hypothetical protein